MKHQLKKLWKQAFDSTTSYTNLFFDYLYADENVRFEKEKNKIISVVYTLPYDMSFCGQAHKASYICGVATDKKFRGQGIVSRLMERTLQELYQEEHLFCALIPMNDGLFHFYKRFGFSTSYQAIRTVFQKTGDSLLTLRPLTEYQLCAGLYSEKIAPHDFSFLMPPEHFDFLARESRLFAECAFSVYQGETFCGYIFYAKSQGADLIREVVTDKISLTDAVNALCKKFGIDSVSVYTPCFYGYEGEQFSIGMLRIVNVRRVLELFYEKSEKQVTFEVTDELIPENNGIFTVSDGKVKITGGAEPDYRMTVTELQDFLCRESSPFDPYINMLLN